MIGNKKRFLVSIVGNWKISLNCIATEKIRLGGKERKELVVVFAF